VVSEWQPIDTAPKDGTVILVFLLNFWTISCRITTAAWSSTESLRATGDGEWLVDAPAHHPPLTPTHWMPLPPPPAERGSTVYERMAYAVRDTLRPDAETVAAVGGDPNRINVGGEIATPETMRDAAAAGLVIETTVTLPDDRGEVLITGIVDGSIVYLDGARHVAKVSADDPAALVLVFDPTEIE